MRKGAILKILCPPENSMEEDIEIVKKIIYKETCCESYKTPKGRCYTCPENRTKDPDEDDY